MDYPKLTYETPYGPLEVHFQSETAIYIKTPEKREDGEWIQKPLNYRQIPLRVSVHFACQSFEDLNCARWYIEHYQIERTDRKYGEGFTGKGLDIILDICRELPKTLGTPEVLQKAKIHRIEQEIESKEDEEKKLNEQLNKIDHKISDLISDRVKAEEELQKMGLTTA